MYKITESEALRMYDGMMDAVYGTVEVAGFIDYADMLEDDGYEIVEG